MMESTTYLLVHGAWHGGWCWSLVAPGLVQAGHRVLTPDLPGNGIHAAIPSSATAAPFDPGAFASEVTASATVTLAEQADALESLLTSLDAPAVLVAHSMGGHVATAVAERVPERIRHLVYVTAFMPASGVPAVAYIQSDENAGELVGPLFQADPEVVGALRIHPSSPDPAHRAAIIAAFAGTVPEDRHAAILHLLTPDLPVQVPASATATTPERWGSIPRTYVRCARDRAIMPACQDRMIAAADAATPGNPTQVVDLDTCHSPFLSDPDGLVRTLAAADAVRRAS